MGSDGKFFTQAEVREIIAYAAQRGIRVMPEFDIPGHTTAWLVSHPELGSAPGPYQIDRRWGIHDPTLDPTNEAVYTLLDGFLGEMAQLFPDQYLHIGGDEVNGKHWTANAKIQQFIKDNNLKDNHGLQVHFNKRIREILQKHGKKFIGWDEILHPDLPKDSVIHSWRGATGLNEAARQGFTAILSNGYYLDHALSARRHYLNDPLPANTPLTPEQQARVLGGEACMWAEWISDETIDMRIWPRGAAVAERLWSPREVNDVADMYRRLAVVSRRLEEAGSLHLKNPPAMLRRYAGSNVSDEQFAQLQKFAALFETGALGVRSRAARGQQTQHTPLTSFADCLISESDPAREIADQVNALLFGGERFDAAAAERLERAIAAWPQLAAAVATLGREHNRPELVPASEALAIVHAAIVDATRTLRGAPADGAKPDLRAAQDKLNMGITSPLIPTARLFAAAASIRDQRATLSPEQWRAAVERTANPPPPAKK